LLVPAEDITAFTRAAERLIRDAHLRARLAEAARTRAQMFSAAAMTKHTEAVYYQLLSGSDN
jgi:hypothetical protein